MSDSRDVAPIWGADSTAADPSANSFGSGWITSSSAANEGASLDNGEDQGTSITLKRFPSFGDAGPMVEINIGNGTANKQYLVYKNFATYFSPVFERAFNGKFIEAKTQTYNITDFKFPDVFTFVVNWMYTNDIGTTTSHNAGVSCVEAPTAEDLCRLWVLGDRLIMRDVQNAAADALFYCSFTPDILDDAAWIYEETGPDSRLRRLFADKSAYALEKEIDIKAEAGELPEQFLVDLALVYKRDAFAYTKSHAHNLVYEDTWDPAPCWACGESNTGNYRVENQYVW